MTPSACWRGRTDTKAGLGSILREGVALILDIALKLREQPSVAGGVLIL